jgi:DNA mismatch repair protein MutL
MSAQSRIRLLPPEIIHRIAAGEVVDRPASVLKELVENALDAGASKVRVLVQDGGVARIEVEDDGKGMSRADLEVCLQRHATSKIDSLEDLDAITSLGFRGEALAAISSVSKIRIESLSAESREAWCLEKIDDSAAKIKPSAQKRGTKLVISELFYNTPARRKFLRSTGMEALACTETLKDLALSHPMIAWEWYILDAKGEIRESCAFKAQSLAERFAEILGQNAPLIEVDAQGPAPDIARVQILAARPPVSFKNQKQIYLFVNGRCLEDKRLAYSLREAYAGLLEIGSFPAACVWVEADPRILDVNIHPQKREIRWPQSFSLAGLVFRLLRPKLEISPKAPSPFSPPPPPFVQESPRAPYPAEGFFTAEHRPESGQRLSEQLSMAEPSPVSRAEARVPPTQSLMARSHTAAPAVQATPEFSSMRVVGEVGAAWLVLESPEGLVLVDQHAAHERVEFEKLLKKKELLRSKALLVSAKVELPYYLEDRRTLITEILEDFAFEVAPTNSRKSSALELMAVPEADRKISWGELLKDIFNALKNEREIEGLRAALNVRLASSLACHGSVRRGQRLRNEQIKALLKELDAVDWKGLCPHGRPVWQLLSHTKIEESFHR